MVAFHRYVHFGSQDLEGGNILHCYLQRPMLGVASPGYGGGGLPPGYGGTVPRNRTPPYVGSGLRNPEPVRIQHVAPENPRLEVS